MTIAEIDTGVLKLRRDGKTGRADEIAGLVNAILTEFGDRVLAMDIETARHAARVGAAAYQQPVSLPDLITAATAARHGRVWPSRRTGSRPLRRAASGHLRTAHNRILPNLRKYAVTLAKQTDHLRMATAHASIFATSPARAFAAPDALRGLLLILIRP
jgi:hypothetical protein